MNEGQTPTDTLDGLLSTFTKNKGEWLGKAAVIFLQFNALTRQVADLSAAVAPTL